jgi:hypothetical protein
VSRAAEGVPMTTTDIADPPPRVLADYLRAEPLQERSLRAEPVR